MGFGNWSAQTAQQWKNYITNVLNNYTHPFQHVLRGDFPVTGYYQFINGQHIVVYIYNTGVNKGLVATVVEYTAQQIARLIGG